jgi:monoamine oxidase
MTQQSDVIIIGAGVSGLAAARELAAAGLSVTILEARNRTGGRVYTLHDATLAVPIELGAEFIHGLPPETWEIVRRQNLPAVEIQGDYWWFEKGRLSDNADFREEWETLVGKMKRFISPDRSFLSFLDACCSGKKYKPFRERGIAYVEGFHAAHIDRISLRSLRQAETAQDDISGDRQFRIANGYDQVPAALAGVLDASLVEMHLNTLVKRVRWKQGSVAVEAVSAAGLPLPSFTARCAVVTLPLGVLKASLDHHGGVEFEPRLSEKEKALAHLGVANVVKVMLRFRSRFWEERQIATVPRGSEIDSLAFVVSRDPWMPTWWTSLPVYAPVLTGWAGGSASDRFGAAPGRVVLGQAIEALSRTFGVPAPFLHQQLDGWFTHNWRADPFSRGAYSYVHPGGVQAQRTLAGPLAGTLFFAGEATNTEGHSGTVHGAIATGRRAAEEVVSRVRKRSSRNRLSK